MRGRLAIWGAGGHGKVAAETAMAMGCYREIVFLDDDPGSQGSTVMGLPVIGSSSELAILTDPDEVFIAIGDNHQRARAYRRIEVLGLNLALLQHPSAVVSRFTRIGKGTLLMPRAVINPGTRMGVNCIVNTGAIVEHDGVIEDYVHLSPAVTVGGNVFVGEEAHLGIGAIVLPGVHVGRRTVVGAGCVVRHDLPMDVVAVGVPARIIRYGNHDDTSFESRHQRSREASRTGGPLNTAPFAGPQAS
ncbi:MAG TPA: acetyltransferase [Bryobacteraceae bacterium]|nr:acetyltransferase [Bryobacteraceae bacterium]